AALEDSPESFSDGDIVIVRYEGPRGAPGMPEMLEPTSRITALCRACDIRVALMTDGRFSGGSVGLVIGHVSPEAFLGGAIALFLKRGLTPRAALAVLKGQSFTHARRRGKLILVDLSSAGSVPERPGSVLGLHLGMIGRVLVDDQAAGDPLLYASNKPDPAWH